MLRNKPGVAVSVRSEPKQIHDFVSQLVGENEDLREEIRQLRAAMRLWAEVAAGTCLKCSQRMSAGVPRGPELVQVLESLHP